MKSFWIEVNIASPGARCSKCRKPMPMGYPGLLKLGIDSRGTVIEEMRHVVHGVDCSEWCTECEKSLTYFNEEKKKEMDGLCPQCYSKKNYTWSLINLRTTQGDGNPKISRHITQDVDSFRQDILKNHPDSFCTVIGQPVKKETAQEWVDEFYKEEV